MEVIKVCIHVLILYHYLNFIVTSGLLDDIITWCIIHSQTRSK